MCMTRMTTTYCLTLSSKRVTMSAAMKLIPKEFLLIMTMAVLLSQLTTGQQQPGGKVVLTQHALDYAAQQEIIVLSAKVQGKTIPDQSGKADVVIGHIDYEFTGMHITGFGAPSSTVTVNPDKGITWALQGASVSMEGDWKYTLHTIFRHSSHGSFDLSASGVSITASFTLGEDAGRPTIHSTGCSSFVGDVDVKFHGGDSWLLNFFSDNIEDAVEDGINDAVCKAVIDAINNDAAKTLADLDLTSPIGPDLTIDYSLVSAPDFSNQMIAAGVKGEVFWTANRTEAPFSPLPLPVGGAQMVTIMLSDYVINTLGYVEQIHSNVQWYLTKKDLPPSAQDALNMTCDTDTDANPVVCLGNFFIQIKKVFPSASWELNLTNQQPPQLTIDQGRMFVSFGGTIDFYGRLPNQTREFLFSTYTNATVSLLPYSDGTILKANATKFQSVSNVTKYSPAIGPVYPEQLKTAIGVVGQAFILPNLTNLGQKGLNLPSMKGLLYINTTLNLTKGALILSTDLEYNPPPDQRYKSNYGANVDIDVNDLTSDKTLRYQGTPVRSMRMRYKYDKAQTVRVPKKENKVIKM